MIYRNATGISRGILVKANRTCLNATLFPPLSSGAVSRVVVGIERTPFVYRIPPVKDIRRTGKKKELALKRKSYEALQAENQRLKSQQISFRSQRGLAKSDSAAPRSSSQFILPDLNEPLSENLD
ncbi:uncharacterized protein A4U43_UnF11370 [Asparagus officinalis]|uniref:Uncharacterized protein n=1 Tax=Asparagus officinalis TaxID=4686 RepID=A0A1R3L592_ASPOF|nr:uncharacterized protein A4U43_UnF11370 [Asparagus officinalis]